MARLLSIEVTIKVPGEFVRQLEYAEQEQGIVFTKPIEQVVAHLVKQYCACDWYETIGISGHSFLSDLLPRSYYRKDRGQDS